jgi:hypothetical protein
VPAFQLPKLSRSTCAVLPLSMTADVATALDPLRVPARHLIYSIRQVQLE